MAKGCCAKCDGLHGWGYNEHYLRKLVRKVEDEETQQYRYYEEMVRRSKKHCRDNEHKKALLKEQCKCEEVEALHELA